MTEEVYAVCEKCNGKVWRVAGDRLECVMCPTEHCYGLFQMVQHVNGWGGKRGAADGNSVR